MVSIYLSRPPLGPEDPNRYCGESWSLYAEETVSIGADDSVFHDAVIRPPVVFDADANAV